MLRLLLAAAVFGLYVPFIVKRVRKGAWMSLFFSFVCIAAGVYAGLGLMLYLLQPRIVFQPWREIVNQPGDVGLEYESVRLATSDGIGLDAWYLPVPDSKFTVLFCHGNAGNISHRLDTLLVLRNQGFNCLIFDYRGYGRSEGKPTEEGVYLDAEAGWQWLRREKGLPAERIVLFGRSLGGCVAAELAARLERDKKERPAGLVLESTFTSVVEMGRHLYPYLPVGWFVRYRFDAGRAIEEIRCPVLIIHSPEDEIVPYQFGRMLYEKAGEPKQFCEIAGSHNEGFSENLEIYGEIWKKWSLYLNSRFFLEDKK